MDLKYYTPLVSDVVGLIHVQAVEGVVESVGGVDAALANHLIMAR